MRYFAEGEKMILEELIRRYPKLTDCSHDIEDVYNRLLECFHNGGRLYICGNGGSAADSLHMVGELVKSFVAKRHLDPEFVRNADSELVKTCRGHCRHLLW